MGAIVRKQKSGKSQQPQQPEINPAVVALGDFSMWGGKPLDLLACAMDPEGTYGGTTPEVCRFDVSSNGKNYSVMTKLGTL
jgi:hypothetical protein